MSSEMWAVRLLLTCLVVMFAYVANEAARLLDDFRKKRKTLGRLSTACFQLLTANGALVLGEPLPDGPWPYSISEDCSDTMPRLARMPVAGEPLHDDPSPHSASEDCSDATPSVICAPISREPLPNNSSPHCASEDCSDTMPGPAGTSVAAEPLPNDPLPHSVLGDGSNALPIRSASPTSSGTRPAWGTSKGLSERRASRGPSTISPPASTSQGSKRRVDGRQSRAWSKAQPQISCGDLRPAKKRPSTLTNQHSSDVHRASSVVSDRPEFARALVCKRGQPVLHAHACRMR
jgi:hypothetical protein